MPEGDTLYRTAEVLWQALVGDEVVAARGRPGGVQLQRVVGSEVARVHARGKHLLIDFGNGLTLHTHLRMDGSWHRYRPGERWRAARDDAVAIIETERTVAVCFKAPTVELLDTRAVDRHPTIARLGPDLLSDQVDDPEILRRCRRLPHGITVAEALLDQEVVAGIGNVYRSEVLFSCSQDPFESARTCPDEAFLAMVETARRLLRANLAGGQRETMPDALGAPVGSEGARRERGRRWVYRRAGRPCRRCGTPIRSTSIGRLPRRLYWCPGCQGR